MMKIDCMGRVGDEPRAGRKSRNSERAATKAARKRSVPAELTISAERRCDFVAVWSQGQDREGGRRTERKRRVEEE